MERLPRIILPKGSDEIDKTKPKNNPPYAKKNIH